MKESYTIQISELQRNLLIRGLQDSQSMGCNDLKTIPGDISHGGYETAFDEHKALIDMLIEMPTIEDTHNTIHGLCL